MDFRRNNQPSLRQVFIRRIRWACVGVRLTTRIPAHHLRAADVAQP